MESEKPPEPHELNSVWRFCDPRQAAAIALEAFTGCRPQVLGKLPGTDGLRTFGLPEMIVDPAKKKVSFEVLLDPYAAAYRDALNLRILRAHGVGPFDKILRYTGRGSNSREIATKWAVKRGLWSR